MKLRFDFKSIRFRLWICFLVVAIGILGLVWMLQILMLNHNYEDMKITEVNQVSDQIASAYARDAKDLTSNIQNLSYTSDLYVMMERNGLLMLFTPEQDSTIPVFKYKAELPKLREMNAQSGEDNPVSYKFGSAGESYSTLAFCRTVKDSAGEPSLLYIFAPLYPLTSTINILRKQLLNVTVIALILAFISALLFANRISKPIKEITAGAKLMGKGDYNVKFAARGYSEIEKLSSTLNTACVELGRSDNLQKDLIANVSHDLKTPLTMVKSYAEMIRDLSGDNPEKRNEHLNVIIEEADRMDVLVSDMSTVSQLQNAKIQLTLSTFDLRECTASILASYEILEAQDGYNFVLNAPKDCLVTADENRIKQVIANLTGNAVKYCGDNKEINVTIRRTGRYYRLEVKDHGPGIAQEDLAHIWDRYFRTSSNYTRTAQGSGLGLSIVKQILMLHNAEYGVESEIGKGSTFWFELEAAKN